MVRTLIFNADGNVTELQEHGKTRQRAELAWTHLVDDEDKAIDHILDEINKDEAFEEDFLEDQRPRLSIVDQSCIIVIGAPVKAILNPEDEDDGIIQLSFIIRKNRLISVSTRKSKTVDRVMDSYLAKSKTRTPIRVNATIIFSRIFEQIVENVIKVTELLEKKVEILQERILRGEDLRGLVQEVSDIRDNLYYTQKILRADIEVVREVLFGKAKLVEIDKFNAHIEDRLLYSIDLIDVARESLNGLHGLYMASLSNKMNQHIYRLTLYGTLIFIPTVIASFWGMNVDLPFEHLPHAFWLLVLLSVCLSMGVFLYIKHKRITM